MRNRGTLRTAAFICLSAISTPLLAQTSDEQLEQCADAACAAQAYLERREYDSAIAAFDEAIRRNPQDPALHHSRGVAYSELGDHVRAIADYDLALRLGPQNGKAYFDRGRSHAQQGNDARTIADYAEALRLNVQGVERVMADAYLRDVYAAQEAAQQQRDLCNGREQVAEYARIAACSTGVQNARPGSQRLTDAYFYRGRAYLELGYFIEAIGDCDEAIRLDPQHVGSHRVRGKAYSELELYDLAIADYDVAIRLDPRHAGTYVGRGRVYSARRESARAIADYSEAIRLSPQYADAYAIRALSYDALGDTARAAADRAEWARLTGR